MAVRISVRREGGVCTNGKERNHSGWGVGRDNGGARPLRAAKPDPAVRRTATRLPGSRLARPRGGIANRGSQSPTETRLSSRFPGSPSPNGLGSLGQLTVADFNTGVLSRAVGKFCKRGAPDARPGGHSPPARQRPPFPLKSAVARASSCTANYFAKTPYGRNRDRSSGVGIRQADFFPNSE